MLDFQHDEITDNRGDFEVKRGVDRSQTGHSLKVTRNASVHRLCLLTENPTVRYPQEEERVCSFLNVSISTSQGTRAMAINPDFLSPCSLYCGVCAIYIAHRDNNVKLKERLVNLYKGGSPGKGTLPSSETLTVDDIRCRGCLSDERFMHCRQCEIRDCTQEKRYTGCHECDEFPCHHIDNFSMTVGKKVILRSVPYRRQFGTEKWVQDEEARYVCPDCGNIVFRGAMKCNRCKMELDLD